MFTLTSFARAQTCPNHTAAVNGGNVQSKAVVEASGLAASRRNSGALWTHNDSGGPNRIYALGANGAALGEFILSGTTNLDWEDIAVGPGPSGGTSYIYVGDIGDNLNFRATVRVYRIPEPLVNMQKAGGVTTLTGVQTITLAYPDGPRDAETLMVDTNGDLYIVTKRVSAVGRVYRAAFPQSTSATTTMQYVASIPWGAANGNGGATGGDIAADGSAVIVRRTSGFVPAATLWRRPPGAKLADVFAQAGCDVMMPSQPQGESIAFSPFDLTLFTLSEGRNQPLLRMEQAKTPGDIDGDGTADVDDLLTVINSWGPCPTSPVVPLPCPGDADGDGSAAVDDLLLVINHWGAPTEPD